MSMLIMLLGGAATGAILQPSILSPGAGNITSTRTPPLVGSDFSSTPGISHASTDWQVASDSAFSNIVWQSLNDTTNKTSITTGDLGGGVRYVRVRYKGDNDVYSLYSSTVEFISPWASGANATITSATDMDVNASTTITLQPGTYRVTLWGGGGGGAEKAGSGGSAGSVTKDVTYTSATSVAFTIGTGGGGTSGDGDNGNSVAGSGGSPGGGGGASGGGSSWNGAGGGGYSTALGMTAAGGGGGSGDYWLISAGDRAGTSGGSGSGAGGTGGSGSGSAGSGGGGGGGSRTDAPSSYDNAFPRTGGQGGSNSGSFSSSSSGSTYASSFYGRTFGAGASGGNQSGQNGGARIQKLA